MLKIPEPLTLGKLPLWNKITSLMGSDIAVDLGTANTLVYVKGVGVALKVTPVSPVTVTCPAPYCMMSTLCPMVKA